jgi:hypothetical protein
VNVAIADATVATWDGKYTFQRPRPSENDPSLTTSVALPASPAYPSEHAAAAGAASAALGYLVPDDVQLFAHKAEEANQSRLMAGVQYPSRCSSRTGSWSSCGEPRDRACPTRRIGRAMDGFSAQRAGSLELHQSHSAAGW